jgi:hypothetical protein
LAGGLESSSGGLAPSSSVSLLLTVFIFVAFIKSCSKKVIWLQSFDDAQDAPLGGLAERSSSKNAKVEVRGGSAPFSFFFALAQACFLVSGALLGQEIKGGGHRPI